ncbi:TPA: ATP-binding protein [Clostridium perfringens]|nr:ATP-binding protein [Clostridium perfringens]
MNYKNTLNKVKEIICNRSSENWIIIGDNSSGKSELLKNIVEEFRGKVYFIDSVNRYFDIKNVNLYKGEVTYNISATDIVNNRVQEGYHNLKDSFGQNEHIERLYQLYEQNLKNLVKEFMEIDFIIEREELSKGLGDGDPMVKIDGEEVELSSGYQAIVRLFSEIIFYCEELKGDGLIVIDEIDEFLSPRYSAKILGFLIENFTQNKFIVSTHSSDLIASSRDCGIIAMKKNGFSVLDSNDFSTLTEVNTLFAKIFCTKNDNYEDMIEEELQKLLDLKISDNWFEAEENEFQSIKFDSLTPVQKVIYKQIQEW